MDKTKMQILMNKDRLIRSGELCNRLNICESTLWYYRRIGLPFFKIGGRVYFDLDDVAEFLVKNNTIKPCNPPESRQGDTHEQQ